MNTGYYVDYRSHNELLQLRRRVDGFESGEIYQKITAEYEKKLALKDKEINRLTKRNDLLANKNRLLLWLFSTKTLMDQRRFQNQYSPPKTL